eukprot:3847313-Rhodomonas_salina.2
MPSEPLPREQLPRLLIELVSTHALSVPHTAPGSVNIRYISVPHIAHPTLFQYCTSHTMCHISTAHRTPYAFSVLYIIHHTLSQYRTLRTWARSYKSAHRSHTSPLVVA